MARAREEGKEDWEGNRHYYNLRGILDGGAFSSGEASLSIPSSVDVLPADGVVKAEDSKEEVGRFIIIFSGGCYGVLLFTVFRKQKSPPPQWCIQLWQKLIIFKLSLCSSIPDIIISFLVGTFNAWANDLWGINEADHTLPSIGFL
ncbi:hypothetical protein ZIOFF_063953 [Zingiber officinale]|uniref:Uncharacterized protein n=1 Tax=Zingiber officinale TaxID=94328 RepID=A0A8J5F2T6_ZINOF|nr:hypothetical protein ZIOFF_063953 [Zingiber officinale]